MMNTAKKPLVYAIVLHYLNEKDTSECIESLMEANFNDLNIVIVDNCSPNNSLNILEKKYPQLTFLKTEFNSGNAGGLNVGVKFALEKSADYILLSDNDMVFHKDFLAPLIRSLDENSEVGIVSPKILYKNNPETIYCAGGRVSRFFCGGIATHQGKKEKIYNNLGEEISFAEGCCLFVKRKVFENIGLMNEKFFMYFEDVDFSIRVRKEFKIIYNSDSIVYHKCGAGIKWYEYSPLYYYYYTRNRFLIFKNDSLYYKIYVFLFSTANSIAKTLVLLMAYLFNFQDKEKLNSLKSLWKGYREGLILFFN
ncbi:MAG: hypothetical protein CVV23_02450 [Ignavibacteriae bacterium HGW-Ignavibacteriae-2]|nr:MAG: hypothetical protein CVV23_02450 [Ignavibacteriae bacterium HGW-Ignavibacteriae-2]